jgi:chemotaxis signal transduction protein
VSGVSELQIVNFTVGPVHYGVPVEQVREVRDKQTATPIPGADPCVVGVTNLRGQIITLIDLKRRLSLEAGEGGGDKIIVIEKQGHAIGVLVDSVTEVSTVPRKDIEVNSDLAVGFENYVIGVGKQNNKLVVLLNMARIVAEVSGVQIEATGEEKNLKELLSNLPVIQ